MVRILVSYLRQDSAGHTWTSSCKLSRLALAACLLLSLGAPLAAQPPAARIWYVDASNLPGPGNGNEADPFLAIQDGIDAAAANDTVRVAAGLYDENLVMKSGVDVRGAGAGVTILAGSATVDGTVLFDGVSDATLSGFTVSVRSRVPGVDRAVVFRGRTDGTAVLAKCVVRGTQYGAFIWAPATPTISGSTFFGEGSAEQGILINNAPASATIRDNVITGYFFAGIHRGSAASPAPRVAYNDLFDNGQNYRGLPDATGTDGNISADPLFVSSTDLNLQASSPAIDAGDPSSPADPDGTRADMGALAFAQPTGRTRTTDFALESDDRVHFVLFSVPSPGRIGVEVTWTGGRRLEVELQGRRRPALADPTASYAAAAGLSPLSLSTTVTATELARGVGWRLVVRDPGPGPANAIGTVEVTTPFDAAVDEVFQREKVAIRSGEHWPSPALQGDFLARLAADPGDGLHALISLNRACDCVQGRNLERLGLVRQSYLPGHNAFGFVSKAIDLSHPEIAAALHAITPLEPEDKIDPHILVADYGHFVVSPREGVTESYVLNPDGTLDLTVVMARDVTLGQAREILSADAMDFRPLSDHVWQVTLPPANLVRLAARDEVEWIDPGSGPPLERNNRTRAALGVGAVQGAVINAAAGTIAYGGLSGNGVTVGVEDTGIDVAHTDFNLAVDIPLVGDHGTHVAGIVAASGFQSNRNDALGNANGGAAFQWRGMAPRAQLIDSTDLTRAATVLAATGNSMDVSNHSAYALGPLDGAYPAQLRVVDQMIRGGTTSGGRPVPRRPQTYAAGNNGTRPQFSNQFDYYSIDNQLKNAINVGNWDAVNNLLAGRSSLGPAHDGRIKPDLVAPGTNVTSTEPNRNEVQRIDFVNAVGAAVNPTQGSYTLTFGGNTTAATAWNANAATIQARLVALAGIAAGDVTVAAVPGPTRAFDVTFTGNLGNRNVAPMIAAGAGLDPGVNIRLRTQAGGLTVNGYRVDGGTSMAAPATAGVIALLLEAWQTTYATPLGTTIDANPPLPSTLRAVLIQTATDIVNNNVRGTNSVEVDANPAVAGVQPGPPTATVGPDYATGWGLINAQSAAALVQDSRAVDGNPVPNRIVQDSVNQNRIKDYDFVVAAPGNIRVTLAWDDVEAAVQNPATNPTLVNDLDLELIAPDGTIFYPWQLGHTIQNAAGNPLADNAQPPGTAIQVAVPRNPVANPAAGTETIPAAALAAGGNWVARRGKDHLNNVEQVVTNAAQVGHWRARVLGFNIPSGAQDFSLVGFPYPDLPDLVVEADTKVGLPNIGDRVTFSWEAQNIGPRASGAAGDTFDYQILLSRDFTLGADDVLLVDSAQRSLGPLAAAGSAGDRFRHTSTVTLTQAAANAVLGRGAGDPDATVQDLLNEDVFLLIRADSGEVVLEHNETNLGFVQLARLVDAVLVMDRSGSMRSNVPVSSGAQTKLQVLQDSANLFLDLMRLGAGDRLAEVSFANGESVIWGPGDQLTALTAGNLAAAKAPVAGLAAGGGTNIRGGLGEALGLLPAAVDPARRKVVIFFSDGMRTAGGDPTEAAFLQRFTDKDVNVYSVGFGTEGGGALAGIDIPLLQTLANAGSGGFFQVTSSPVGLDKFFVDAVAGAIDAEVIVDPIVDIPAGARRRHRVEVGGQDSIVNFVLAWDNPAAALSLSLITPSGQEITAANAGRFGSRVARISAPAYDLYEVRLPLETGPEVDHAGGWQITIHNPGASAVRYAASAFAQSTLRAEVPTPSPGRAHFSPGDPVPLRAFLHENGRQPITGATVTATPTVPNIGLGDLLAAHPVTAAELATVPSIIGGEPLSLRERMFLVVVRRLGGNPIRYVEQPPFLLPEDPEGGYAAPFSGTVTDGPYRFLVGFEAMTPDCDIVQREVVTTVGVRPRTDPELTEIVVVDPDPDPGGDGNVAVVVTPGSSGGLLGPGLVAEVSILAEGWTPAGDVTDRGDGSYSRVFRAGDERASLMIEVAGTKLPARVIATSTPAPISVKPPGSSNHMETPIAIGLAPKADADRIRGVVLVAPGQRVPLELVSGDSGTVRAVVPPGLTPGVYRVHLEGPDGLGPSSATAIFQVVAKDGSMPAGVAGLSSTVARLSAAADGTGLIELGRALRYLQTIPDGPNLDEKAKSAAVDEILELLVASEVEVEDKDVPALRAATRGSQIDARYVPPGKIGTPAGRGVKVDLGNGVSVVFDRVKSAGQTTLRVLPGPSDIEREIRGDLHVAYRIESTAGLAHAHGSRLSRQDRQPRISVEIPYRDVDFKGASSLHILQREGGKWVDRTVAQDRERSRIRARLRGLSDLVIVRGDG